MVRKLLPVWIVSALLFSVSYGQSPVTTQPAASPTTAPATAPLPVLVPSQDIAQLDSLFAFTTRLVAQAEMAAEVAARMDKVLVIGGQLEAAYPAAANLYEVRGRMLKAALQLMELRADQPSQDRLVDISKKIVASSAPPLEKLQADFLLTRGAVAAASAANQAEEADKQIQAFVQRYPDAQDKPMAMAYAVLLAHGSGRTALRDQFLAQLEQGHYPQEAVSFVLRRFHRHTDLGKPFIAELNRLDATKLKLPQDLSGEVVVVDFWATWCPPCVAAAPKMVELYAKYHPQGVEFVGISLDPSEARGALEKFIAQHDMKWIQTFSGLGPSDPTAIQYGVDSIPSVWVIGRDGNVISDDAETDVEAAIRKALEAPATTQPASAPSTQGTP